MMVREITAEQAATEIKRAYGATKTQRFNEWMFISDIASRVDLTLDEIHAGIRYLARTEDRFCLIPESNQKSLTAEQWAAAISYGNQWKHLICWY